MYSIAISARNFFDSQFANEELAKEFQAKGDFMVLHSPSEGFLKTLASRVFREYSLEAKVYEI